MWQQYRKTLVPIQLFIFAAAITCYFVTRLWPVAVTVFLIMQVGAVLGAAWAARLKAKMRAAEDRLPLKPRG
jgi:hypothetical protein